MAATPLFLVTDVGLAAASVATPVGPFIHITGFKIGSAFGYEPSRSDTGLNGNTLYSGVPISYQNIGDNTINVVLRIPPDAGPFDFGEVGVFIGDNADILFAKAVFDSPQTKFSSLGTNLQSTFTFNCLIKLEQSVAIFKIDTESGVPPSIWEVDKWSDIYPPGISANPDTPAILVRELDGNDNSSFLHKANDEKWTLGTNYARYGARTIASATLTSVQFAKTQFPNVTPTAAVDRQFVIEFDDGFYRSVGSVIDAGANWQFNLNPDPLLSLPTVGAQAYLYNNNGVSFASLTDVPLMTSTVQGIARLGVGINADSPGVISARGLLHSAPGTGLRLGTLENLNYFSPSGAAPVSQLCWPSGLYTIDAVGGYPVNYPPVGATSGILQVVNTFNASEAGTLYQLWLPTGPAGATSPAYYRSIIDITNFTWSPWRRLNMSGSGTQNLQFQSAPLSFTMPSDRIGYYAVCRQEESNIGKSFLYINGQYIIWIDVAQGGNSGMYTVPLNAGDVVEATAADGTFAYLWLYPVGVTGWN